MTKEQMQVKEFMLKAGQECPAFATADLPDEIANLRKDLIEEELMEYADDACTLESVADALGDLLYVVLGTAIAHGIDLEPIFQEIHRSNMTKFIDGYKREDGKWMKGPSYEAPNLGPILERQA